MNIQAIYRQLFGGRSNLALDTDVSSYGSKAVDHIERSGAGYLGLRPAGSEIGHPLLEKPNRIFFGGIKIVIA